MKIRDRIIELLQQHGDLSVKEMVDMLDVSKQAIHIAINQLLAEDLAELQKPFTGLRQKKSLLQLSVKM